MLTFNFSLGQITTPLLAGEFLKGKTHASFVFVSPMVPGAVLGPLTTILLVQVPNLNPSSSYLPKRFF